MVVNVAITVISECRRAGQGGQGGQGGVEPVGAGCRSTACLLLFMASRLYSVDCFQFAHKMPSGTEPGDPAVLVGVKPGGLAAWRRGGPDWNSLASRARSAEQRGCRVEGRFVSGEQTGTISHRHSERSHARGENVTTRRHDKLRRGEDGHMHITHCGI